MEQLSFAMDMKVFFKTIQVIFAKDDVAVDTDAVEGNMALLRAEKQSQTEKI